MNKYLSWCWNIWWFFEKKCYYQSIIDFWIRLHNFWWIPQVPFLHAVVRWKGLVETDRMLWVTYRHPPGVEYETKLDNISVLRVCPSHFEDFGMWVFFRCAPVNIAFTGHPPLSGFFFMWIAVHGSQSGSFDLNIEFGIVVNNDSFQIMSLYGSHYRKMSGIMFFNYCFSWIKQQNSMCLYNNILRVLFDYAIA